MFSFSFLSLPSFFLPSFPSLSTSPLKPARGSGKHCMFSAGPGGARPVSGLGAFSTKTALLMIASLKSFYEIKC